MAGTSDAENRLVVCTPGTKHVVWEGAVSTTGEIFDAVNVARKALDRWQRVSADERISVAESFAELAESRSEDLAKTISDETGKPKWEARAEADLIPAKVKVAIQAYHQRSGRQQIELPQGTGSVFYRGIGVMAVLGPFNFPAHLPNGHMVPALIAGNTVVLKPSEMTPGTGELLGKLWNEAGPPDGVLRIVHGDGKVGAALVACEVDGVLFTGSYRGGCAIHRSLAGRPNVLLALEMGGNNPLVIHRASDLNAAAYLAVISAFVTAGQRCTCARRLILPDDEDAEPLLEEIVRLAKSLRVGMPDDDPEPFMGPVISPAAADHVLEAQAEMIRRGAIPLVPAEPLGGNRALIGPGCLDVTAVENRDDEEIFGPLLQVIRVRDFEAAIDEANRTRYGLSASLLSDDANLFDRFRRHIRAGVINWNQATVGASGRLPFGGRGASGNHRPSGFFAADYCSEATATLESDSLSIPKKVMPGIPDA